MDQRTAPENMSASQAFICSSLEDYANAAQFFKIKQLHRRQEFGSCNQWTLTSVNNELVALIKSKQFNEAERRCLHHLKDLESQGQVASVGHCSVQCNLAACLFLSGQVVEADELGIAIAERHDLLHTPVVVDSFQAWRLTRDVGKDCLVLRDSGDLQEGIFKRVSFPIADTASPVKKPTDPPNPSKTQNRRTSGFTELRRKGSGLQQKYLALRRKREQSQGLASSSNARTMETRGTLARRARPTSAKNQDLNLPEIVETLPSADGQRWVESHGPHGYRSSNSSVPKSNNNGADNISPQATPTSAVAHMDQYITSARVQGWLQGVHTVAHRRPRPAQMSDPDAQLSISEDSSNECQTSVTAKESTTENIDVVTAPNISNRVTNSSISTDRSSVMRQNLEVSLPVLLVSINHDDKNDPSPPIVRKALLDTGSTENCISDVLADLIGCSVDDEKTKRIHVANNTYLDVLGHVNVTFSWNSPASVTKKCGFYVVRDSAVDMLLGNVAIQRYHLLRDSASCVNFLWSHFTTISNGHDCTPASGRTAACPDRNLHKHTHPTNDGDLETLVGGSETTAQSETSSVLLLSKATTADIQRSTTFESMSSSIVDVEV